MKKLLFAVLITLIMTVQAYALTIVRLGPEYFPESDRSRALSNGYIYVGEPDLDPSVPANQKDLSVQQEDGSIVTVTQPIRTSAGGVPVYNGSPVTLLVSGNYSLLVQDSLGSQEYYVPSVDGGPVNSNLSDYGCDFATMVSTVGSVVDTHVIVDCLPDPLSANVTVSDNITLEWRRGFPLTLAGFDFVTDGGVIAGDYRLFNYTSGGTADVNTPVNPRWFGALGDGSTDDTDAFVRAASTGSIVRVPPAPSSYTILFDATDALTILANLGNFRATERLDFNFDEMNITVPATVTIPGAGCENIFINGAAQTTLDMTAAPNYVARVLDVRNISGNYYNYIIRIVVDGVKDLAIGDWVMLRTSSTDVTVDNPDETASGSRHNELDGFLEVDNVINATTFTVIVKSRQSSNQFPGGGVISDEGLRITDGPGTTTTIMNTVFNFEGIDGFSLSGSLGGMQDIGIVGNGGGSAVSGILMNSVNSANVNQTRSIGLSSVGVANFSGSGINIEGFNSRASGYNVMSTGNDAHGIRAKSSTVSFDTSIASNNGTNGFFATTSASFACRDGIATGNRNTGFIANRSSTMTCSNGRAVNNGNYQDEVDGGFSDLEGKGYESEAGSIMTAEESTAIYNTAFNYYALAGSNMYCHDSVGSASLTSSGFYCILASQMSARRCVARNNEDHGFYTVYQSGIVANDTEADGNGVDGYRAIGASTITVNGASDLTALNNPLDGGGPNQIIESASGRVGANGIITRGENLEIASGVITITHGYHRVDTEGLSASDDLNQIDGGVDGQTVTFRSVSSGRDVTFKHLNAGGNITMNGSTDKTLGNLNARITLQYDSGLGLWVEQFFSQN